MPCFHVFSFIFFFLGGGGGGTKKNILKMCPPRALFKIKKKYPPISRLYFHIVLIFITRKDFRGICIIINSIKPI